VEIAVEELLAVLDVFLDKVDDHIDEGRPIDLGDHARRIDRAINKINCIKSGICPPPKLGRKKSPHRQR
jgi:hypothetical protein